MKQSEISKTGEYRSQWPSSFAPLAPVYMYVRLDEDYPQTTTHGGQFTIAYALWNEWHMNQKIEKKMFKIRNLKF